MFDWIYILLLITLLEALLFFFLLGKNILSPSVIVALMYSISEFIAMLNADNWEHKINEHTTLIIIATLFVVACGEAMAIFIKGKNEKIFFNRMRIEDIFISKRKIFFILTFQICALVYYYMAIKEAAYRAGWNGGEFMIVYAREVMLQPEIYGGFNKIAESLKYISHALAYVFSFVFLYNYILLNKKKFLYILPVLIYSINESISSGRLEFIYLIAFWIVIGGCFYFQKNDWKPSCNIKIIKYGFLGLMLFLMLFVIVGSFKSAEIIEKAWHHISFYAGMSIPSLDEYFLYLPSENERFGEHTLIGVYRFLSKFTNIETIAHPHLEFVCFNETCGNVYTGIRRLHQDFGYFGLYFFMFMIGFLYRLFFDYVKNSHKFPILLFAALYIPIFMVSIDEEILIYTLSFKNILVFVLMYYFYKVLITKISKKYK